jgi:hypothetical protein
MGLVIPLEWSGAGGAWHERAEILKEGWFATGDLGRVRSVLNVGGMKCFPDEMEEVINEFCGVKESRVYERNHREIGVVPGAELVLEKGREVSSHRASIALCRTMLSRYKVLAWGGMQSNGRQASRSSGFEPRWASGRKCGGRKRVGVGMGAVEWFEKTGFCADKILGLN